MKWTESLRTFHLRRRELKYWFWIFFSCCENLSKILVQWSSSFLYTVRKINECGFHWRRVRLYVRRAFWLEGCPADKWESFVTTRRLCQRNFLRFGSSSGVPGNPLWCSLNLDFNPDSLLMAFLLAFWLWFHIGWSSRSYSKAFWYSFSVQNSKWGQHRVDSAYFK